MATIADAPPVAVTLRDILRSAVANGASDVHIRPGSAPLLRVDGDLRPLDLPALTEQQTEQLVLDALPTSRDRDEFLSEQECDFALHEPDAG